MSMIRGLVGAALSGAVLALVACTGSDYQGGGRRTDFGMNPDNSVALSAGGDFNASGGVGGLGGVGGALAEGDGQSGFAGCAASGVDGLGLALGCTP